MLYILSLITLFVWVFLSYFAYQEGKKREIGGGAALAISIFLSPIIGLLCIMISKPLPDTSREMEFETEFDQMRSSLAANEIEKLNTALQNGEISYLEYAEKKDKLMKEWVRH